MTHPTLKTEFYALAYRGEKLVRKRLCTDGTEALRRVQEWQETEPALRGIIARLHIVPPPETTQPEPIFANGEEGEGDTPAEALVLACYQIAQKEVRR